jgi:hypothetical protein
MSLLQLKPIPRQQMRQTNLDGVVCPKSPRTSLRSITKIGVHGPRRDELVAMLRAGLRALVQETVGIVARRCRPER